MNARVLLSAWPLAAGLLGAVLIGVDAQTPPPEMPSPEMPPIAALEPGSDTFDHETHEGLFPLCVGCHIGAESGIESELYPAPQSCATCHDGVTQREVRWQTPEARPSNLEFAHGAHAEAVISEGDAALTCASCHATQPGATTTTRGFGSPVVAAENCLVCHGTSGVETSHLAAADCATCHVAVTASSLSPGQLAGLPAPRDHASDDFLADIHGGAAIDDAQGRCVTCHVQDQCAGCHVNAAQVDAIVALPRAPADLGLATIEPRYPTPQTHLDDGFAWDHGSLVPDDAATCATCHTSNSCRSCHIEPVPQAVAALPTAGDTLELPPLRVATGTVLHARPPESHNSPFYAERHGAEAATAEASCATCHAEESFCTACHEGLEAGGALYHPPAYVMGHAAEAAQPLNECATCHDAVAFCRTCHEEQGLQSRGRLGPGYHDAEPLWLLRHPQAARQQLESCTTCHTQRDCLQCHSQLGAFQISPHGPDFDAQAAWERNPVVCRACHIGDPFGSS